MRYGMTEYWMNPSCTTQLNIEDAHTIQGAGGNTLAGVPASLKCRPCIEPVSSYSNICIGGNIPDHSQTVSLSTNFFEKSFNWHFDAGHVFTLTYTHTDGDAQIWELRDIFENANPLPGTGWSPKRVNMSVTFHTLGGCCGIGLEALDWNHAVDGYGFSGIPGFYGADQVYPGWTLPAPFYTYVWPADPPLLVSESVSGAFGLANLYGPQLVTWDFPSGFVEVSAIIIGQSHAVIYSDTVFSLDQFTAKVWW